MRVPAMLAVILATTTAAAQPARESFEKRDESSARVTLQDKKKKKPPKAPKLHQPGDWFEVADSTPVKFGTSFFVVAGEAKSVRKLRFDAVAGKVIVRRVVIHFDDGAKQIFAINKTLDERRAKSTFVELGGIKPIDRIVVTTEAYGNGAYTIFGSTVATQPTCC